MDGDLAFLPPASVLPPVEALVGALGSPGPHVGPADPPPGGLPTPLTGQRSATVRNSTPVGPSPTPDTQLRTSSVVHTDDTPVVPVVENLDPAEVRGVPVLSPVIPEPITSGMALCQIEPGQANILTFTIYLRQLARGVCVPVAL